MKKITCFVSGWSLTELEVKFSRAFMWSMANGRGREMISSILELLLVGRGKIFVTNLGGRGVNDPGVKQLHFKSVVRHKSQSSDSSPEISPTKDQVKRKSYAESPRETKMPVRYGSETQTELSYISKNLIPDVLVEEIAKSVK